VEQVRRLGKYRLMSRLGSGGMAVVYRAVLDGPHGFQRPVALKRVRPELATDPTFGERFLREARLSALLRHRGVVQIHELGDEGGECFLVMELVEGHSLVTVLDRCRQRGLHMPIGVALYIASEIAAALDYVHALADDSGRSYHIVHRDISPSNVMLGREGSVKLLDFGIAKAVLSDEDNQTRTGSHSGKFRYFSPEQALGKRIDGRSDLFALGSMLYECLTLRPAFPASDQLAALEEVKQARFPVASSVREDLPPEVDEVLARLLARHAEDRFARGGEVVNQLAPLLRSFGADAALLQEWLASEPELRRPTTDSSALDRPRTARASVSLPAPRRWPIAVGLAGVAVVVAAFALHFGARATPIVTNIPVAPLAKSDEPTAHAAPTGLPAPTIELPPVQSPVAQARPPAVRVTAPGRNAPTVRKAPAPKHTNHPAEHKRSSDIHDPFQHPN
jgi:serine/threonine protein kinase